MEEIESKEEYNTQRLAQLQSLPLNAKIMLTRKRVLEYYNHFDGQVYLSFSGGKDSTVLKHLIENYVGLNIPSVFINTGLEYPEVRKFAISQSNVEIIRPKMTFRQVIEKYGYPVISKEQSDYIYQYKHAKSEKTKNLRLYGNNNSYKISEKWKFLLDAPFEISSECCKYMKKNPAKEYERERTSPYNSNND